MNNQPRSISVFALAVLGIAACTGASGQARCDCDVIVGQCRAEITEVPTKFPGSRFFVRADTQQCAIVEWSVDGSSGITTVWDDGEEISRVSPRKPGGSIEVQSCRVCKDRLAADAQQSSAGVCKAYEQPPKFTEARLREALKQENMSIDDAIAQLTANLDPPFILDTTGYFKDHPDAQKELWKSGREERVKGAKRTLALMRCVKENP